MNALESSIVVAREHLSSLLTPRLVENLEDEYRPLYWALNEVQTIGITTREQRAEYVRICKRLSEIVTVLGFTPCA